jgi:hypothetical protein
MAVDAGDRLIFLISQPRAGSTLLQKMLGAHPDVHTTSEPWVALHPLFALRQEGASADYSHALAHGALGHFLGELPGGEDVYVEGVRLMLSHLYGTALRTSGKVVFLDKTPRYYFIVPELRRVFPAARFVFLVRNPLAVLSSMLEAWVGPPYFADRYGLRLDLAHDLLTAPDLLAAARDACGPRDACVSYEQLVQEPDSELRRVCDRLGLEFAAAMIDYGTVPATQGRWAYGDQARVDSETRPVAERADRWATRLRDTPGWLALAQSYLHALGPDLVGRLGYDYAALAATIGLQDGAVPPALLEAAVLTPVYGESCDYLAQSARFSRLLERLATGRAGARDADSVVRPA